MQLSPFKVFHKRQTQNSTPTLYVGLQFRIYSQLFEEDGYIVLV